GRLELLSVDGREVLLDGAHNPAGAAALAAALDELRPFLGAGRVTLLTASMADKDVGGVVDALAGSTALADARIVATAVAVPRALPADELARAWSRRSGEPAGAYRTVAAEPDVDAALDRILAGPTGPVVVAGSLYLVGAVRARLVDDPLLHDPTPDDASPPDARDRSRPSAADPGDNPSR
ncbi:MAG TPA: cyanophycin synthetase, partial [Candidatus Limnocylindrales bacterium]|nr:cyanophycin synthetase [Candidatus Limnocylindrales bacterium]